jgi:hypothetical protein
MEQLTEDIAKGLDEALAKLYVQTVREDSDFGGRYCTQLKRIVNEGYATYSNSMFYEITDNGKCFYINGGYSNKYNEKQLAVDHVQSSIRVAKATIKFACFQKITTVIAIAIALVTLLCLIFK